MDIPVVDNFGYYAGLDGEPVATESPAPSTAETETE